MLSKMKSKVKATFTEINKMKHTSRAPLHPDRQQIPSMRKCLLKSSISQSNAPSKSMPLNFYPPTNGLFTNLGNNNIGTSRPGLNKEPSFPKMPRLPPTRIPQPTTLILSGERLASGKSTQSIHPDSSNLVTSYKRPGFFEGPDGFSYKRRRVAHTTKPVEQICIQATKNITQQEPVIDSRDVRVTNTRNKEPRAVPTVKLSTQVRELNPQLITEKNEKFPDYKKQYVTIRDADQRKKYKAEYKVDLAEYRDLHCILDKVSKRFSRLEERLNQDKMNLLRQKAIKTQIIREHRENKCELVKNRRRFQYLHLKMSYIKRLISEFDQETMDFLY